MTPHAETSVLGERLHRLLERTSGEAGRRLAERLLPASFDPSGVAPLPHYGFYWLRVPEWLAEAFGLTPTPEGRRLVADLCWIQCCVYATLRIQDDLIDGDSEDPCLAVRVNHLMVEAARCASRHFDGRSPFWTIFQETIDATSRTVVQLDTMQRSPERPPGIELELYSDLSACLKIASAGIALAAGRLADWQGCISPALDRVAVAAQIVDDLRDLGDDLRAERINYAAWYLARPIFGRTAEATEAVVASNLATTDRLSGLLAEATGELDRALEGLDTVLCPRAHAYFSDYRQGILELGQQIVGRARALLAPDPSPQHATAAAS